MAINLESNTWSDEDFFDQLTPGFSKRTSLSMLDDNDLVFFLLIFFFIGGLIDLVLNPSAADE